MGIDSSGQSKGLVIGLHLLCRRLSNCLSKNKMETIKKKMEGLKARLESAEAEAKAAEDELNATNAKADATEETIKVTLDEINDLEDQLDQAESKLVATESNLHLSLTRLDEVQRAKGVLVERGKAEDELSARLTKELTARNDECEQKIEAINTQIEELEGTIDTEDERAVNAENRVKELEVEVLLVGQNLKTMEISEDQSNVRDSEYTAKIADLTTKLQSFQEKAEKFEELTSELEKTQDDLEQKLTEEKEKYDATKRDLDLTLAEIQEMNI